MGRVLGEDLGERPARVDRERVEVEQDVALREAPLERRDVPVGGRGLEHLAGVLGVEDREVRRRARAASRTGAGAGSPRSGTCPPMRRRVSTASSVSTRRSISRAALLVKVRSRIREGSWPGLDQARDAVDERARLPGARAGDDEDRAAAGEDDVALLVVQLPVVVDPVGLQPRRRLEDVLALHGGSLARPP